MDCRGVGAEIPRTGGGLLRSFPRLSHYKSANARERASRIRQCYGFRPEAAKDEFPIFVEVLAPGYSFRNGRHTRYRWVLPWMGIPPCRQFEVENTMQSGASHYPRLVVSL